MFLAVVEAGIVSVLKKQNNSLSPGQAAKVQCRMTMKENAKLLAQKERLLCLVWEAGPKQSLQTRGWGDGLVGRVLAVQKRGPGLRSQHPCRNRGWCELVTPAQEDRGTGSTGSRPASHFSCKSQI